MNRDLSEAKSRGFTLVELLVVLVIISILAVLALVSLQGPRKKARDSQRKADLYALRNSLELYLNDQENQLFLPQNQAVVASPDTTGLSTPYLKNFPTDPKPGQNYYYLTDQTGKTFLISTNLETDTDPDRSPNPSTWPLSSGIPSEHDYYLSYQ